MATRPASEAMPGAGKCVVFKDPQSPRPQRCISSKSSEKASLSTAASLTQWLLANAKECAMDADIGCLAGDFDEAMKFLRSEIVGADQVSEGSFGPRLQLYLDHTTTGQGVHFINRYMMWMREMFANCHTEDSATGLFMTSMLNAAVQSIEDSVNSEDEFVALCVGTGSTAAVLRLQQVLGIYIPPAAWEGLADGLGLQYRKSAQAAADQDGRDQVVQTASDPTSTSCWRAARAALRVALAEHEELPLVIISSFEHHSNELPWREGLCEVVRVPCTEKLELDLFALEHIVREARTRQPRRLILGSLAHVSGVTGATTNIEAAGRILHKYNALFFVDYSNSGPYVAIDCCLDRHADLLDGLFLSPHKFLGGEGACGVLILRKDIYDGSLPPTFAGGGTVLVVGSAHHAYSDDIQERENAGTPGSLQIVQCALAMEMKTLVGAHRIEARMAELCHDFMSWIAEEHANEIFVLGNKDPKKRLPIISMNIVAPVPLHPGFVCTLLNDLFGIRIRSGDMDAGPSVLDMLEVSLQEERVFLEMVGRDPRARCFFPKMFRISVHFTMSQEQLQYLKDALSFVVRHGYWFLQLYGFDLVTEEWKLSPPLHLQGELIHIFSVDADDTEAESFGLQAMQKVVHFEGITEEKKVAALRERQMQAAQRWLMKLTETKELELNLALPPGPYRSYCLQPGGQRGFAVDPRNVLGVARFEAMLSEQRQQLEQLENALAASHAQSVKAFDLEALRNLTEIKITIDADEPDDAADSLVAPTAINSRALQEEVTKLSQTAMGGRFEEMCDFLCEDIVGHLRLIQGVFGPRLKLYCDFTASGQSMKCVNLCMQKLKEAMGSSSNEDSQPWRAKAHSNALSKIRQCCNARDEFVALPSGTGTTGAICRLQQAMGVYIPPAVWKRLGALTGHPSQDVAKRPMRGVLGTMHRDFHVHETDGKASWMKARVLLGLQRPGWNQAREAVRKKLRQQQRLPLIIISGLEHHSNELSWREGLADVVRLPCDSEFGMDISAFETILQKHRRLAPQRRIIAALTDCSNVTGMRLKLAQASKLCQTYKATLFIDYAASGPYTRIDCCPEDRSVGVFDACYFAPHKFLGGDASCGLLLMRRSLYNSLYPPTTAGNGVAEVVGRAGHVYKANIEQRENAGTPGILQIFQCALALELKEMAVPERIEQREELLLQDFLKWVQKEHPKAIRVLGTKDVKKRLAIVSFTMAGARPLHHRFVTKLLSDLFGVQTRAGCSCAGPYGTTLLGLKDAKQMTMSSFLLGRTPCTSLKPGWCRLNLHYTFSEDSMWYLKSTLSFVAEHGWRFLCLYTFNLVDGSWIFSPDPKVAEMLGLSRWHPEEHCFGLDAAVHAKAQHLLADESRRTMWKRQLDKAKEMLSILPEGDIGLPPQPLSGPQSTLEPFLVDRKKLGQVEEFDECVDASRIGKLRCCF